MIISFYSCKKSDINEIETPTSFANKPSSLENKTNPFSLRNIQKALLTLSSSDNNLNRGETNYPKFIYFRFNPQDLTTEQFQTIENDTTVHLMDIPFANMSIYNDAFALDSAKAELLKDGSVYGVTTINNQTVINSLSSRLETQLQLLDTIVKIPDTDTSLQYQALREVGINENEINRIRLCFFKRPQGFVRYRDTETGNLEPVRGMEVWSLLFGVPIWTFSDANGYYEIPYAYSVGTIMGTKAKNPRVNVKPLNTSNRLLSFYVPYIVQQFVVGSVHIDGWVTPCQMRDGKDFNFEGHTQVRLWSQILNGYYFHDRFSNDDGITKAPLSMVCYANWGRVKNRDFDGVATLGNASTPMLGHLPSSPQTLIVQYLFGIIGGNITNYPNLFNLVLGLKPDMTIHAPAAQQPQFYSSVLSQTVLHEMSHASHYQKVGNYWWLTFINVTVGTQPVPGNPYGNQIDYTDIAESWAEFLGSNYAARIYLNRGIKRATNNVVANGIIAGRYYRINNLQENEFWFFGGNWIPYGCYHDLMDDTNTAPNNAAETWDLVRGVTIKQLYDAHDPKIINMCAYRQNFILQNSNLSLIGVERIFDNHNVFCR